MEDEVMNYNRSPYNVHGIPLPDVSGLDIDQIAEDSFPYKIGDQVEILELNLSCCTDPSITYVKPGRIYTIDKVDRHDNAYPFGIWNNEDDKPLNTQGYANSNFYWPDSGTFKLITETNNSNNVNNSIKIDSHEILRQNQEQRGTSRQGIRVHREKCEASSGRRPNGSRATNLRRRENPRIIKISGSRLQSL
jgi:hypothetical protein